MPESHDVVVLGAGLAGLTAAYTLRDLDVVVLERDDRVGGRTYSGDWLDCWFNAGAQFVWDRRTLDLCRQLGIEVVGARGAHSAIYIRGRFVQAPNPYLLFLKMPLSLGERIDFARTILKLRRIGSKYPNVDRMAMDARSLADITGEVTPVTRAILDRVVESSMALSTADVSGYSGLSYAIHLFGGDANDVLKAVVGGTQQISIGIAGALGEGRVRLGCEVTEAAQQDGQITVRYRRRGSEETVLAKACVVALPAGEAARTIQGLPADKVSALRRIEPYGRAVSVACLTRESRPLPWHQVVVFPVLERSFESVINNSYFARKRQGGHTMAGGSLVTISTMERADLLWDLPDEEVGAKVLSELKGMFPDASDAFSGSVVNRWQAFPPFRRGALADQEILRRSFGSFFFCGDYTAQPGTPGAVGSGYHTAVEVRNRLPGSAGA